MLWTDELQEYYMEIKWATLLKSVHDTTGCGSLFCTCDTIPRERYMSVLEQDCNNQGLDFKEAVRRWNIRYGAS